MWRTYRLRSQCVWHGKQQAGRLRCVVAARSGHTGRERAEIHGVDWDRVQNSRLGPGLCRVVERQLFAERGLVLTVQLPDDEPVIPAVATQESETMSEPSCDSEGSKRLRNTHVMMRSAPQPWMPRMAFSCGRQTAVGRMVVRSQRATKPSASPLTRRSLPRKNVSAWTWALWPRRNDFGCGAASAMLL